MNWVHNRFVAGIAKEYDSKIGFHHNDQTGAAIN